MQASSFYVYMTEYGGWRSSLKPFKAGVRGRLGSRYRAPKGGAQGGRYKGEKVNRITKIDPPHPRGV